MVLRCSLLGHDYGEPEVERERDTRGSEVVLTVQEYERCTRCGVKNVISENTEVTSISTDAAADETDYATVTDDTDATTVADPGETDGSIATDAVDLDDSMAITFDEGGETPSDESAVEVPRDENGDPITDDAEILEPEDEPSPDRQQGEWPDSDDVGPPVGAEREPSAWPGIGAEDDELDSAIGADDDPTAESASGWDVDTASDTGSTERDDGTDDAILVGGDPVAATANVGATPDSDTGFESAGEAPSPGEPIVRGDVPTEYFCPSCSFVAPGDRGSLRPGDICPSCRKGYLGEREQ